MTETLPIWTPTVNVTEKHPELFHYTGRSGVEGILKNNQLWATYFRNLNDSTECFALKQPLIEALVKPIHSYLIAKSHESFKFRSE